MFNCRRTSAAPLVIEAHLYVEVPSSAAVQGRSLHQKPGNIPVPETSRRATLTVWSASADEAAQVLQALRETYEVTRLQSLSEAAGEGPVLLLPLPPALMLCRAMSGGTAPAAALTAWLQQTRALLELNRRDRRRIRVVDLAAALAHPAAFRRHFGLNEGSGPEAPRRNSADDLFLLTLAKRLLAENPQARRLANELEAVSVDLSGKGPTDPAPPQAVVRAYQAHRRAEEELETLRRRNAELEDTATRKAEKARAAQDAIEVLQAQTDKLQADLDKLARRNGVLEEETAVLPVMRLRLGDKERSLQAAGDLLRQAESDQGALKEELERLRAGQDRLVAEIDRIHRSRSYRVTGPLRRLRAAFSRRGPA